MTNELATLEAEFNKLKTVPYVNLDAPGKARYKILKDRIKELKANMPVVPEDDKKEEMPEQSEKTDDKTPLLPQEMIARTKKELEEGPQMTIAIPLAQGEKPGAKESVIINGYRREFTKGSQITLPKPMAELVLNHYNIGIQSGIADEYRANSNSAGKNLGDISSD